MKNSLVIGLMLTSFFNACGSDSAEKIQTYHFFQAQIGDGGIRSCIQVKSADFRKAGLVLNKSNLNEGYCPQILEKDNKDYLPHLECKKVQFVIRGKKLRVDIRTYLDPSKEANAKLLKVLDGADEESREKMHDYLCNDIFS